ncbi:hypothetical protein ACO0R3_001001 [Hanseniaspora guilliermondii]
MSSLSPIFNSIQANTDDIIPTQITSKQNKRRVSITGLLNLPNLNANNVLIKKNRIENKRIYYKRQRKILLKRHQKQQQLQDKKRRKSFDNISLQQSNNEFEAQVGLSRKGSTVSSVISRALSESRDDEEADSDNESDMNSIRGYNDYDYINNGSYHDIRNNQQSMDYASNNESALEDDDSGDYEDNMSLTRSISLPSVHERDELIESDNEQVGMKWLLAEHSKRLLQRQKQNSANTYGSIESPKNDSMSNDEEYDDISLKVPNYNKFDHHLLTGQLTSDKNNGILSYHDFIRLIQLKSSQHTRNLSKKPYVNTTTTKEISQILKFSTPLIMTFLLEQIFNIISSLTVGHLGARELSAVAISNITYNIIIAFFEAICTSYLDILMPQAYASGNYKSVGLHLQRSLFFSMFLFTWVFIFVQWKISYVIEFIVPEDEKELVGLAASYMKVLIWGTPGFILFENLKRYVQAMGKYEVGLYVLILCFPINVIMSYLLVWNERIGIGFLGAAVAIVINFYLMFFLILIYIVKYTNRKCWNGFTKKSLCNWWDLFKLVLPGIIMVEAEDLSYELLTLIASYLGTKYLAAQSAISIITVLFFNIGFGISVVVSNRLSNYIGVKNIHNAALTVKASIMIALGLGFFVWTSLSLFRYPIAKMFTNDNEVLELITDTLPVVGFIEIFDCMNCILNSCLRASAKQFIGSIINLSIYYLVGIPLAIFLSMYMEYKVIGIWAGIGTGMALITCSCLLVCFFTDWNKVLEHFEMLKEVEEEESDEEDEEEYDDGDDDDSDEEEQLITAP